MDSSLDSIWDEPAIENSPKRPHLPEAADDDENNIPRAPKRPRSSLFFSDVDDSDEDAGPSRKTATHKAPPLQEVDMDALFAEFDDEDLVPLPARIDEEAVTRKAEARYRNMPALTPHQVLPSSSPSRDIDEKTKSSKADKGDDEKKARKKILKLDENRLLGPHGFPQLIKMTKDFKIKGKGHEATDLNRLLQTYQYWTHQLYPKTQFHDTVERVEKLSHSRRMNVSLSVWRDEAHGILNRRKDMEDDDDDNEDGGNADHVEDTQMDTDDHQPRPRSSSSIPSSRASSPPVTSGAESEVPLQPRVVEAPKAPSQHGEEDDEEAFWRSLDEFGGEPSGAQAPPPVSAAIPPAPIDDDDEMWDIINEVEQSTAQASNRPPPASPSKPPSAIPTGAEPAPEDDWDDMYL